MDAQAVGELFQGIKSCSSEFITVFEENVEDEMIKRAQSCVSENEDLLTTAEFVKHLLQMG